MAVFAGIAVLIALAAFMILRRHKGGWTAVTNGNDYGATVDADGSFDFPQAPNSIHYLTKPQGSMSGKRQMRITYRLTAATGLQLLGAGDDLPALSGPILFFQREGDDWSGEGEFETYRWWAGFAAQPWIADGQPHELVAPFSGNWNAVMSSDAETSPQAFQDALANCAHAGVTFRNREGMGHGQYATGKARFDMIAFAVE